MAQPVLAVRIRGGELMSVICGGPEQGLHVRAQRGGLALKVPAKQHKHANADVVGGNSCNSDNRQQSSTLFKQYHKYVRCFTYVEV